MHRDTLSSALKSKFRILEQSYSAAGTANPDYLSCISSSRCPRPPRGVGRQPWVDDVAVVDAQLERMMATIERDDRLKEATWLLLTVAHGEWPRSRRCDPRVSTIPLYAADRQTHGLLAPRTVATCQHSNQLRQLEPNFCARMPDLAPLSGGQPG